jgi:hypothetical protein
MIVIRRMILGTLSSRRWCYGMQLMVPFCFYSFCSSFCCLSTTGADKEGTIRSLALPNLSAVTRDAAQEYFDNSWTLYETLFAGLKGEEGFFRYV